MSRGNVKLAAASVLPYIYRKNLETLRQMFPKMTRRIFEADIREGKTVVLEAA